MALDWTQITTTNAPSARNLFYIAKDISRNKIVLFGGGQNFATLSSFKNDTWEYDTTDWTQITTAHAPTPRLWAMYEYDQANNNIVLFGGYDNTGTVKGDTWIYNGTDWTQQSPAHNPTARYDAYMCWDPVNNYILMYGGAGTLGGTLNAETWKWSAGDWTQLFPTASPPKRQAGGKNIAYDPAVGKLILHGGADGGTQYHTTYRWDATTWTQIASSDPVGMGPFQSMHYCLSANRVVAKGDGRTTPSSLWDGTSWTNQTAAHGTDAATAAMCEGLVAGSIIVFMGQLSASWTNHTWYGFDTSWVPPASPILNNAVSLN